MFVNRKRELEFLESKWVEDKAQLIIVYGRRRIGKTTLLKEFLRNKPGTYILFADDSYEENLRRIKEAFAKITGRKYFMRIEADVDELIKYLAEELGGKRVVIVFDEFQYLVKLRRGCSA